MIGRGNASKLGYDHVCRRTYNKVRYYHHIGLSSDIFGHHRSNNSFSYSSRAFSPIFYQFFQVLELVLDLLNADWLVLERSGSDESELVAGTTAETLMIVPIDFEEPFEKPFVAPNDSKQTE